MTAPRALGAIALLVIGGLHYQQYRYAFYSSIPTIGPLFLLTWFSATALGLFLLTPASARRGQVGDRVDQAAALAGLAVAAGAFTALLVSESTPLLGFMESGYWFVIVLAIASETAAIAMLGLFMIRARTASRASSAVVEGTHA
jgi:hypothetical protein